MSTFEFINHTKTVDDQYVKEIVTLQFNVLNGADASGNSTFVKLRVPYFRKPTKDQGMFWSQSSTGVQFKEGKKYMSPRFSDEFLNEDITTFLNERSWEGKRVNPSEPISAFTKPQESDGLPF